MRLKDKVAIVTGAGSGIGQATAQLLAREGAGVVAADVHGENAEATVATIRQEGGEAIALRADVSREEDAENIAAAAVRQYARIDILVNDAGIFVRKGFEATAEDWNRSWSVNVLGTALCAKHVLPAMKKTGGAIVNMGSISSFIAEPNKFAYSSTKAAILQMTRNMAMDLAPFKIRVNCVCPGTIITNASLERIAMLGITLDQFKRDEAAKTLLRRVGEPLEVARAILFLASDEASYITGASLVIDGGYTAV